MDSVRVVILSETSKSNLNLKQQLRELDARAARRRRQLLVLAKRRVALLMRVLAGKDAVGDLHLIERLVHRLASWWPAGSLERSSRKSEQCVATISSCTSRAEPNLRPAGAILHATVCSGEARLPRAPKMCAAAVTVVGTSVRP